jgi:pSer/pThr/pTyr-binding forkhead associated (FHA) protein
MPERERPLKPYEPGQLQLTVADGPAVGKSFILKKARTVIGRGEDADIVLPDNSLSREHAEVILGPLRPDIRDLKSRNGVHVNGTRVSTSPLRSGDAIRLGKCLLIAEEVRRRRKKKRS